MKHRVSNPWVLVATALLAGPDAFASDFKTLPPQERNLAVYDAFWENLKNNHYDPQLFTRANVRALRDQGRRQAAAVDAPADLYDQVLDGIAKELPESNVAAQLPLSSVEPTPSRAGASSQDETTRLAALLASGPGFDETTMRRGSKNLRVVTEVAHGSPADAAGIRPGWRIVSYHSAIDARTNTVRFTGEFLPLNASEALAWERGELPDSAPETDKVVKISYAHRALPMRDPVESRRVAKGVRYLRFDGFGDEEAMLPVFRALRDDGAAGLIIDLRWNAGGNTRQAQKVAGALLGEGLTMGFHQDAKGYEAVRTARSEHKYEGPLVVLIGPRSGRCSEMLASAIKDHRRGKLVGRMTNGSLLTADTFPLPDGGYMSVPTRDFRSSTNQRLQGVGVAPDVRVLPTLEDVRAGRDPTIERAVRLLSASGDGHQEEKPSRFRSRRGEFFPPI